MSEGAGERRKSLPHSADTLTKARKYFDAGKVREVASGAWTVAGSQQTPYTVTSDLRDGRLTWIRCTCPFSRHNTDLISACSHTAAVLIAEAEKIKGAE